jgi:hypothetical protein
VTLTSVQYSIGSGSGSGSGSGGLSGNVASGLVVFAVPNEGLSGLLSFDLNQVCMVPMCLKAALSYWLSGCLSVCLTV